MKYLKYFESNSEYYTEITNQEYHELNTKYDWVAFTDREKSLIDSVAVENGISIADHLDITRSLLGIDLKPNYDIVRNKYWYYTGHNKVDYSSIYIGKDDKIIISFKIDDDWFIISYSNEGFPLDKKHYKCDQIEGLIKFINDHI